MSEAPLYFLTPAPLGADDGPYRRVLGEGVFL